MTNLSKSGDKSTCGMSKVFKNIVKIQIRIGTNRQENYDEPTNSH